MKSESLLRLARVFFLMLAMGIALPATAIPILFEATIDGAQANAGAGSGSAGTGTATMIFEDSTNLFSWEIEWADLSAPAILAHFHGPATPAENAGAEVAISGLTSPSIGDAIISDGQATDLLAGSWYINIHTLQFLGGEIRGQVVRSDTSVPVPATFFLILLGLSGLLLGRQRTA